MTDVPLTDARRRLSDLVQRAVHSRERTTITDQGQPAAVLLNAEELADLEEALAVAQYRQSQADGSLKTVPHDEVCRLLGIPLE